MDELIEGGYNPGEQVKRILEEALELESYDKPTFANRVDRVLVADGRLASLMRESAIDYATRRLVLGAVHVASHGGWDPSDPSFVRPLRRYLKEHTGLDQRTVDRIVPLLRDAVRLNRSELSTTKRRRLRRTMRFRDETQCYLCGLQMDFEDLERKTGASADHVWPRSIGGLNEEDNLRLACKQCNNVKGDVLSGADFHYERFVRADESHVEFGELMAAWHIHNLSCVQCGRDPSQVGQLFLVRDDDTDCWHVHNVTAYCATHRPKV